ncbi:MAG: thioredoxin family protein [Desulfobacteraceae bacterium]|nr:thioredoxin family protein [Desulfobacteraceae bacterium]MBU4000793.1 thioredoxin family protein [Pseudomonadota bacterium]MBU4054556.1 thioredoxin family protein [Pseudomonadota bacterium]
MKKIKWMIVIGMIMAWGMVASGADSKSDETSIIPTPGRVTMLDLGAHKCIPCKMMAPIIEELQNEYAGRASIVFIDVWKNPDEARRYGVQSIPTQIFYDKEGKEAGRHVGFLDKKSIVSALEDLGVSREPKP